jgi:rSAM/selenodomain-associated transferase 2
MLRGAMLSIVIPTLNAAETLPATLAALAAWDTSPVQLIVADGGSRDSTCDIAVSAGAGIVTGERGRGAQLVAGAKSAEGDWLLFMHADTVLEPGWPAAVRAHMASAGATAAVFRFRLDDAAPAARILERIVAARTRLLALPYGDQGLLISRELYTGIGGFRPIPIMEDVDIVRRLGRARLAVLDCAAITSAGRYRREGYLRRMLRNVTCISMWFAGVAPERIARVYR